MTCETGQRVTVAVTPALALEARPRLRRALEAAFPVKLVAWERGVRCSGLIVIGSDPATPVPGRFLNGTPVLVIGDADRAEGQLEPVVLTDADPVDPRLRRIALLERPVGTVPAAPGQILAAGPSGPVWMRSARRPTIQRVRAVLPELAEEQVLYRLLSSRPIAAVALIHFLRAVCHRVDWRPPPLRATFVFDDPNLRWRRYGFIDYPRLVREAKRHRYHAAMAMIPLDAARAHAPTVSLFRLHPEHLSLVCHGNDHLKEELLRPRGRDSGLGMLAQALRRLERFERRTGLGVDRVMIPPHGLCSEEVCHSLAAVGFEALCAIHARPWTAEPPRSPLLAAWRPADFIGGCPLLPRLSMNLPHAAIALSAFLDHPIVIYGHHGDLADGPDRLAEVAARVNSLGDVCWMSMGGMVASNVATRMVADQLLLRLYSRRVCIRVPPGVNHLTVTAPECVHGDRRGLAWSVGSGVIRPFGRAAVVRGGQAVEIRLRGPMEIAPANVAAPTRRPWPAVRRAVAEARDRSLPLRSRLAHKRGAPASV